MENREKLLEAFDEVGIIIENYANADDIDLREYIEDSMQFISAIVAIEDKFDIEIPEEMYLVDSFSSLNALNNIINHLILGEMSYDGFKGGD